MSSSMQWVNFVITYFRKVQLTDAGDLYSIKNQFKLERFKKFFQQQK